LKCLHQHPLQEDERETERKRVWGGAKVIAMLQSVISRVECV
jgi:hypothetical protein